ncbi:hypothetical protein CVT26_009111 [Gymnopilus dilepis]|uniref:Uncharacterized protein n=1 Tax=Gymnopilus dilepis TaxID=231916 RepID=A0A409Y967_9AGAR|nr:hypothetical protein CVT26_009111 [Gymnopilus dilepis]
MPHSCHRCSCRGFQADTDACYCGHSAADHGIVPMFVPPRGGQAETGCTAYRRRNIYSHLRFTPDQTCECGIDWLKHDSEIDESAPGPLAAPAPTHLAAQPQATAWVAPVRPMPTTAQARASAPSSAGPSIGQRPAPFGSSTPPVVPHGPFSNLFSSTDAPTRRVNSQRGIRMPKPYRNGSSSQSTVPQPINIDVDIFLLPYAPAISISESRDILDSPDIRIPEHLWFEFFVALTQHGLYKAVTLRNSGNRQTIL